MTILFFDTETTGLPKDKLPADHMLQPYIVQLAAQLCEDDGTEISGFTLIVDPGIDAGVKIPESASAIHGITEDRAKRFGVRARDAMWLFESFLRRCDLLVAHNLKFDKAIIETALSRHHAREIRLLSVSRYCTMEKAAPVVNIPPTERMLAAGFNGPKSPKLEECIKHFFDEDMSGAHDAQIDLMACRRVYFHLKSLEDSHG